jgi:hypothetical protein
MGLIYLTLGQMAEVTDGWVGPNRNLFLSVAELKPMMPHVERVHAGVLTAPAGASVPDPSSKEFIKAEKALDHRHDHAYRAGLYLGRSYREWLLAQETVDADAIHELDCTMSLLMPDKGHGVSEPYLTEAGNAQRAQEYLNNFQGAKESIQDIYLAKNVTCADVMNFWFKLAAELGDLERQKTSAPSVVKDGSKKLLLARNDWVNVVSTVLKNMEHATLSVQDQQTLRGPVTAAIESATAKYLAKRAQSKTPAATTLTSGAGDE